MLTFQSVPVGTSGHGRGRKGGLDFHQTKAVYDIESKCFPINQVVYHTVSGYRPDYCHLFFAKDGEQFVGFSGIEYHYGYNREPSSACIWTMGVDPAFQGRGIAAGMMKRLLRHAACPRRALSPKVVTLHVVVDNTRAIDLYRGFGFEITERKPGYYACPEMNYADAFMMARPTELS